MLKIKRNSNNNKITVGLSTSNNLNGLSESNEDFYLNEIEKTINEPIDEEIIVFKPISPLLGYTFIFDNGITLLSSQGFTSDEIDEASEGIQRSFFFYQVFDSPNIYNQNLLFSNYYNGYEFYTNGDNTTYLISKNVFNNISINRNQLDNINELKVYARYYFFNGKTGEIKTFINKEKETESSTNKIFHEINLNLNNNTYTYFDIQTYTIRMIETDNSDYANQIDNNQQKQLNQKPQLPSGTGFNNDGTYENI